MATLSDKQKDAAYKCSSKAVGEIDKIIERLRKCADNLPFDCPEYYLLTSALGPLTDARGRLVITASRCKSL